MVGTALQKRRMKIILRDITQAYNQAKTEFHCIVICHLLVKLKKRYPLTIVLRIAKLSYGLAEARNYWFATYLYHHRENLGMKISPYDI